MITEALYDKISKTSYATAANIGIKFTRKELDELATIVQIAWQNENLTPIDPNVCDC